MKFLSLFFIGSLLLSCSTMTSNAERIPSSNNENRMSAYSDLPFMSLEIGSSISLNLSEETAPRLLGSNGMIIEYGLIEGEKPTNTKCTLRYKLKGDDFNTKPIPITDNLNGSLIDYSFRVSENENMLKISIESTDSPEYIVESYCTSDKVNRRWTVGLVESIFAGNIDFSNITVSNKHYNSQDRIKFSDLGNIQVNVFHKYHDYIVENREQVSFIQHGEIVSRVRDINKQRSFCSFQNKYVISQSVKERMAFARKKISSSTSIRSSNSIQGLNSSENFTAISFEARQFRNTIARFFKSKNSTNGDISFTCFIKDKVNSDTVTVEDLNSITKNYFEFNL